MKILIYIVCFLVLAIIQAILTSKRIILGAIPMVLLWSGTWWIAKQLCRLWDERTVKRNQKKAEQEKELRKNYTSKETIASNQSTSASTQRWICDSCKKLRDQSPCPYCGGK